MAQDHFAAVARRLLGLGPEVSENQELESGRSSFFFEGGRRQHALETIRHLINFGDMVLLIEGEQEAGKSALMKFASDSVKKEVHVLLLEPDASEGTVGHDLITQLAHQSAIFESPSDSPSELIERCLKSYTELRTQSGKRTAILIDDFDRYREQDVRLLLRAAELQEDDGSWVLVLAGSPGSVTQVQAVLENPSDNLHVVQLNALTKQETREYVYEGLNNVGIDDDVLSETSLQWLYLRAKGLPGRIESLLASALFNVRDTESAAMVGSNRVQGLPVKVLSLIAIVLFVSFLFVAEQHKLFAGLFEKAKESPVEVAGDAKQQRLELLDRALEKSKKFETVLVDPADPRDAEQSADAISKIEGQGESGGLDKPTNGVSDLEEKVLSQKPDPDSPQQKRARPNLQNESLDLDGDADAEPSTKKHEVVQKATKAVSTSTLDADDSEAEVRRVTVRKRASSHPAFRDSGWLQTKPKGAYTYQVLGSYKEQTARSFIDRLSIDGLFYIKTVYQGKPWYVVLYGEYPNKQRARDARKSLPQPVAKEKPWIRSMSGLPPK